MRRAPLKLMLFLSDYKFDALGETILDFCHEKRERDGKRETERERKRGGRGEAGR